MLADILDCRRAALVSRIEAGIATMEQAQMIDDVIARIHIWIAVTTDEDKDKVVAALGANHYLVRVFSVDEIGGELQKLGSGSP